MTPLFFSSFMGKIAATSALVLSLTTITDAAFTHGHSCKPCDDGTMDTCVIKASVNLYAGATGYYEFEGCTGVNPTLHLTVGRLYEFDQSDVTNWYHVLGFAYEPDGAHVGVDELEPTIDRGTGNSSCADAYSCPAPMYFMDMTYQGTYSNAPGLVEPPNITEVGEGAANFGLDEVEPRFFHPLEQWQSYGTFSVYLNFDSSDLEQDIFYFCHVHSGMSGRIKLLDEEGNFLSPEDTPSLYDYQQVEPFDEQCGTYNITDYRLPNAQCPNDFVCVTEGVTVSTFATCVEAMNCHMMASMTTQFAGAEALFCHQMIPHHENAVNMAKSLLMNAELSCPEDIPDGQDPPPACELVPMLYDMVNTQNHQIQEMRTVLSMLDAEEYNDCDVPFRSVDTRLEGTGRRERFLRALQGGEQTPAFEHNMECTPCEGETGPCTIKLEVELLAGQYGYFKVVGCEGVNPTLLLSLDRTYIFDQSDFSNWYHPVGFAYEADGAHVGVDELEPGITPPGSNSDCASTLSCPAPMYVKDGEYQGTYANVDTEFTSIPAEPSEDFGLDAVEPLFFHPLGDWETYGPFAIVLNFNVADIQQDVFYFCHIHAEMSGRIKFLDAQGNKVSEADVPALPYSYDEITGHDKECGTFGLNPFELPNNQCPPRFVCAEESDLSAITDFSPLIPLSTYAGCIESMDCAMADGMTTNYGGDELKNQGSHDIILFCRQMIPHHENAVNMAKVLLKTGLVRCGEDDDGDEDSVGCTLDPILRGIINTQNYQIQIMQGLLDRFEVPLLSDCDLTTDDTKDTGRPTASPTESTNDTPSTATMASFGLASILATTMTFWWGN